MTTTIYQRNLRSMPYPRFIVHTTQPLLAGLQTVFPGPFKSCQRCDIADVAPTPIFGRDKSGPYDVMILTM